MSADWIQFKRQIHVYFSGLHKDFPSVFLDEVQKLLNLATYNSFATYSETGCFMVQRKNLLNSIQILYI
jgi:hypothetical protein